MTHRSDPTLVSRPLEFSGAQMDALTREPIRFFEPNFADYMWGGHELYKLKGMPFDASTPIAAESWEVSAHPKYPSKLKLLDGSVTSLLNLLRDKELARRMLGASVVERFPNWDLPLIAKFFDVQKHMSVQVHPSDPVAKQLGEVDPGKGEAFVVLEAYEGHESSLYLGLKDGVTREAFEAALHSGEDLLAYLHKIKLRSGDVYFVPSGILHCWTGGTLAIEVTEPSDLTYRMYDFNRGRPMHIKKGLASVDFNNQHGPTLERVTRHGWQPTALLGRDILETDNDLLIERVRAGGRDEPVEVMIESVGTFDVLMGLEGSACLESADGRWTSTLAKGFSLLIPAGAGSYRVRSASPSASTRILKASVRPNTDHAK